MFVNLPVLFRYIMRIILIRLLIIGLVLAGIFMSSCGYKQRYLRDIAKQQLDSVDRKFLPDYKIQANDILFIRVVGFNKDVTALFNSFNESSTSGGVISIENYSFFNGYNVTDKGFIKIPVLGDIFVKDSTLFGIQILLQQKVDALVNEATVIVKLASYKLIMLGEVNSPGIKHVVNNRISILEAMALAGDVRDLGDRRNVLIIRPTVKGHVTFRVDLTDPNILASENFYLLPNDVVYVEALKAKGFRQGWTNISIILSLISSFIVVYSFIKFRI